MGRGNWAVACCPLPRTVAALQGNRLRVLESVGIVALAKTGWTVAGDAGAEGAKAKVRALPSAHQEASVRLPGSGRPSQGQPTAYVGCVCVVVRETAVEWLEGGD